MINVNFNSYNNYVTDSLYQWDKNQSLLINGLGISVIPEIHFTNINMDRAIVRQATLKDGVIECKIPNSLLQEAYSIKAYIGIYEGDLFKTVETISIPVIARKRPEDYVIEVTDEEVYSFKQVENVVENAKNEISKKCDANFADMKNCNDVNLASMKSYNDSNNATLNARVDQIIAHNNDTEGNTELVDIRTGADGHVYGSAGEAVRDQVGSLKETLDEYGIQKSGNAYIRDEVTLNKYYSNKGVLTDSTTLNLSNKIPCKKGDTFCVYAIMTSPGAVFDKDGNYLGKPYTSMGLIYGENTFTINIDNADYMMLNVPKSNVNPKCSFDDFEIYYGETPSPISLRGFYSEKFIVPTYNSNRNGKNIITFGDSRTWYDGREYNANTKADCTGKICVGYQHYIREVIGANVINMGKSGYTSPQIMSVIKSTDMSNADIVTIAGGVNDFLKSTPVGAISEIGSDFDETTQYGAWQSAIEYILTNYPKIQIVLITPFTGWININSTNDEVGYDVIDVKKNLGKLYHLPIIDLGLKCGFNLINRDYYFADDLTKTSFCLHLNDIGNEVIGNIIVNELNQYVKKDYGYLIN